MPRDSSLTSIAPRATQAVLLIRVGFAASKKYSPCARLARSPPSFTRSAQFAAVGFQTTCRNPRLSLSVVLSSGANVA